jgi:hypothetical protein
MGHMTMILSCISWRKFHDYKMIDGCSIVEQANETHILGEITKKL